MSTKQGGPKPPQGDFKPGRFRVSSKEVEELRALKSCALSVRLLRSFIHVTPQLCSQSPDEHAASKPLLTTLQQVGPIKTSSHDLSLPAVLFAKKPPGCGLYPGMLPPSRVPGAQHETHSMHTT
eukprot:1156043-Pelagomonas_calceolata.AAC.13